MGGWVGGGPVPSEMPKKREEELWGKYEEEPLGKENSWPFGKTGVHKDTFIHGCKMELFIHFICCVFFL